MEILKAKIRDWRIAEGVEVPIEADKKPYSLTVEFDKHTGQLFVTVDGGKGGLTAIVEINEGRPCVHLGNDIGGDNIVHIFALEDGLIATPENDAQTPVRATKSRYSYDGSNALFYSAE